MSEKLEQLSVIDLDSGIVSGSQPDVVARLRFMTEALLVNAMACTSEAIEFRTINDVFRIALIVNNEAREFNLPPPDSKFWILSHCRELLGDTCNQSFQRFTLRHSGVNLSWGYAIADLENAVWVFTKQNNDTSSLDSAIEKYWTGEMAKFLSVDQTSS